MQESRAGVVPVTLHLLIAKDNHFPRRCIEASGPAIGKMSEQAGTLGEAVRRRESGRRG